MKYHIWYNSNPVAMWKFYQSGDVLYKVTELYSDEYMPIESMCDKIFRMMNAVDGDELCVKLGVRSMSVGDMVEVDGQFYQCMNTGWSLRIGTY